MIQNLQFQINLLNEQLRVIQRIKQQTNEILLCSLIALPVTHCSRWAEDPIGFGAIEKKKTIIKLFDVDASTIIW